jgi:gliding motility-associated-like protein
MDPNAINFNPLANVDDNSCVYPEPIFEVPNVITPNGGAENEVFEIKAQFYTEIEYTIQNRWGQLVFEGKGLNPTWDGKAQNGKPVDEGVYFVLYTVKSINGDKDKSGQTFLQVFR